MATDTVLYVPEKLRKKCGLQPGESVTIRAGSSHTRGRILDAKTSFDAVQPSLSLAKRLNIPATGHVNMIRLPHEIRIGPVIGIMTKEYHTGRNTFGPQNSFYRKLLHNLKAQQCIGFVFTPADIDWERQLIKGYTLSKESATINTRKWYPFPDVCYNRYFRKGTGPWSHEILNRMTKYGVRYFNIPVGNKWRVHKMLSDEPEVKPHLPETGIITGKNNLERFLRRYKTIYVKPDSGCQGKGITRIKRENGSFICKRTGQTTHTVYPTVDKVMKNVRFGGFKTFLAQQAIECPRGIDHFDIRIMVQKDYSNHWQVTGMAARISKHDTITSNLHTGGYADRVESQLHKAGFSDEFIHQIMNELERLAVRVAKTIESHAAPLGELGLDFIVDYEGKVWFLEANAKPGRRSFAEIEAFDMRREAILRPVLYAKYLAGF